MMSAKNKTPADLTSIERFRVAWRVSKGMPFEQAAAMEGLSTIFGAALAKDPWILERAESLKQQAEDPAEEQM